MLKILIHIKFLTENNKTFQQQNVTFNKYKIQRFSGKCLSPESKNHPYNIKELGEMREVLYLKCLNKQITVSLKTLNNPNNKII